MFFASLQVPTRLYNYTADSVADEKHSCWLTMQLFNNNDIEESFDFKNWIEELKYITNFIRNKYIKTNRFAVASKIATMEQITKRGNIKENIYLFINVWPVSYPNIILYIHDTNILSVHWSGKIEAT